MVSVALNEGHQAEQFDVPEKLLVARRFVAVRGDEEIVRAVEHALRLGEVVAVQERVGRGWVKGREHLSRRQVREKTGGDFRRRDELAAFESEGISSVLQQGITAGTGRGGGRAERKDAAAQFRRVERRDGLERAEVVFEDVREAALDLESGVLSLESGEGFVERAAPLADGFGEQGDQFGGKRAGASVERQAMRHQRAVPAAGDEQVGWQHRIQCTSGTYPAHRPEINSKDHFFDALACVAVELFVVSVTTPVPPIGGFGSVPRALVGE